MDDFEIAPGTSVAEIRETAGYNEEEELRQSQERRDHLEKLATMNAGEQIYVQISGKQSWVDMADRDSEMGYTDRLIINVRMEIPDQHATSLDKEVWDMMVQKMDLYHQLGHILYTDWPTFEDVLFGDGNGNYGVADEHKAMFKNWFDLIEDSAVQRLLIDKFNIKDDLRIVNDNLVRQNKPDQVMSLHAATTAALMEYKHPVGWIDSLLDPSDSDFEFLTDDDRAIFEDKIYPVIEDLVPEIIDEGDSQKRALLIYNLYKQIGLYFDDDPVKSGKDENHSFDFSEDADMVEQGQSASTPSQQNQQNQQSQTPDIEPTEPIDSSGKGIDLDAQRDYSKKVQQQKGGQSNQQQNDSLEKWGRVIDREYEHGTDMSLTIPGIPPSKGSYDDATRQEAERLSKPLAKDFRQRLKQQQRSQKQTGKKNGKVDSKRLHKTGQGKTNVFQKQSKPNQKDYSCVIVLDRSGSMSGGTYDMMPDAEEAAGALAYALEEVGVSVAQLSLLEGDIKLEKDFADGVDDVKERMFRGCNTGGTPLTDALELAKARVDAENNQPFMIVLTDGEPDHRERYRDTLHECDFPVLGVYIGREDSFDESQMNESAYFHRLEIRRHTEALKGAKNLAKNVMF